VSREVYDLGTLKKAGQVPVLWAPRWLIGFHTHLAAFPRHVQCSAAGVMANKLLPSQRSEPRVGAHQSTLYALAPAVHCAPSNGWAGAEDTRFR
jgi:hypothetical protein